MVPHGAASNTKCPVAVGRWAVEMTGLEPAASSVQAKRSPR